ncbi:MAG: HesA/MoeB/ThiF family protein [Clostridium fessum]
MADFDRVDVSNLQRQILYREQDIGKAKAELAAEQLQSRNHSVQVELYPEGITAENAEEILAKFDVIVDASDNFPTRYLLSDTCMKLGKPDVYGAICEFAGQVTVFASDGPCLRCALSGGRGPIRKPEFGCLWCAWRDSRHDRVYAGGRSIEASFGQGRAADWKNAVH